MKLPLNTCIYRKTYVNDKHHIFMPTNDTKYSCHRIDEGNEFIHDINKRYTKDTHKVHNHVHVHNTNKKYMSKAK